MPIDKTRHQLRGGSLTGKFASEKKIIFAFPKRPVYGKLPAYQESRMALSARNQFPGIIKSVRHGSVMSEIVIDVGGLEIVSLITRSSANRLRLKKGSKAVAVIKSTEVIISTDRAE